MSRDAERAGVPLTNLDQPLFDGAEATKRDLVDYLDAARDRILPELQGRPLSVIRVLRAQQPFMQKNLPKYAPPWLPRVTLWAESSQREVAYALCEDRRSLLWFANQRAVEYHPTLVRADRWDRSTHLVLDIDPPAGSPFATAVAAARLVAQALAELGMAAAVKTSGAKGLHVVVPVTDTPVADVAAATRALAARAERLDPRLATTAFIREDRGGRVFLDARGGVQPAGPPRDARVLPGGLGGPGPGDARGLHGAQRGRDGGRVGPVGRPDAGTSTGRPGAGRGGARDPGGPRAGDARGQAPRPRPPYGRRGRLTAAPGHRGSCSLVAPRPLRLREEAEVLM
jgi:bifunctional non-homologous end joining protein LigD